MRRLRHREKGNYLRMSIVKVTIDFAVSQHLQCLLSICNPKNALTHFAVSFAMYLSEYL